MKTKHILLLLFVAANYISHAQTAPPVLWQKSLGGAAYDLLMNAWYSTDGSSILCGRTSSFDGDVTGNHGNSDGWVVKLDASGNVIWKKAYGGSNYEEISSIKATSDNGYIMAGYTSSNDGDVSGNHGSTDGWVIKTDNIGTIQWKKCIGGTKQDEFDAVQTTADGGYILAGYSYSSDGDLNNNKGLWDGWVVKLDAAGNMQWQKNYGGSSYDFLEDMIQLDDNNFIFTGESSSGDGDLADNYGGYDAWLLKVNAANGNIIWSYQYGGSGEDYISSICKPSDGSANIIGAGSTKSPNDYNVTGNHGGNDVWIISIDETSGILTRANCFGGTGYDGAASVKPTFDKGYIISGNTTSTDGDVSYNAYPAYEQLWVIKLNNARSIDWERTYGGPSDELSYAAFEKSNGGYFVASNTWGNGGDVSGYHGVSGPDYWALNLSPCFVPPVSSATITANSPACGGTVTMSMPGGIAYSYFWYKDFVEIPGATSKTYTATTPGTYTAVVSNGGCLLYTFSPNSIVSIKPVATISPSGIVNKCAANTVTFTANMDTGLTYQWYKGKAAIAGAVNSTYTTKKPGKYKVLVTNTVTQCSKTSPATTVNNTCKESIASANETDESSLQLLHAALLQQNIPNPFNSSTVIQYSLPNKFTYAQITVADITGRVVKQFTLTSAGKGTLTINAGMLAQGVYVYSMYVNGKFIDSKRMVVIK